MTSWGIGLGGDVKGMGLGGDVTGNVMGLGGDETGDGLLLV